ncbi:MarR family winged helix-turn-helix transcriptional regulator [Desulfitobacterium sp. Sab5]|uniref:MarR family winged helix-turn-helix transcriptional regulator n=1 Tax=Desulfitobacterium TaxID=36853 RepID=UPI003CE893F1
MKSIVFENEVWDFLRMITECMENSFRPIAAKHGLTLLQTQILIELKHCGHHTVGSLGGIIGLSGGNASSMCKKLEKAGFIQRIRNPEDERYVQLALTPIGENTIHQIGEDLEERYGAFLGSKCEDEFQIIFECMKKLGSFIREMSEEA